jgi:large subunit ribosomal protein L50
MKDVKLPENLHIQYEPHRFNPATDTMFGGKSAFPRSSTIVTGLKSKKKYAGYEAKHSWP